MAFTVAEHLRLLLGERVRDGEEDTDTFFSDDEVSNLLAASGNNVTVAAALGWEAKAAEYAGLIDQDESGAKQSLTQLFRQAKQEAERYAALADNELLSGARHSVAAVSARWMVPAAETDNAATVLVGRVPRRA